MISARKIYYTLSPQWRFIARRVFYFPIDLMESITGKRHEMEPPKGMTFIGSGDFIGQGKAQLDYLKRYTNIDTRSNVLDIGSGLGRTAVALTSYLDSNARYEGFDVVEKGVLWCRKKISKKYPNFKFTYVPLENDLYNKAEAQAKDYRFPYEENNFDIAYLFSVFTHMQLSEIEQYLREISRTLIVNGQCLASFFVYDSENDALSNEGFLFKIDKGNYRLMDGNVTAANVAVKKEYLLKMIDEAGLNVINNIPGYWHGGVEKGENDFQDLWVLGVK